MKVFSVVFIFVVSTILLAGQTNGQRRFPDDFIFGSASAAYQIEGGWDADGKGENIWDYLVHNTPELINNRDNGDVACDSYHKYKEDVQILKQAGMNFYRFSIAWSRVLPNGDTSVINEAGLQYYDNLINELLANGIEPMITMYHWDLPQKVQEIGGMVNAIFIDLFVDYADVLFARYGDRVKYWATFNEPIMSCEYGYAVPDFAPLVYAPGVGGYLCTHNVIITHAKVYHLYQEKYKREGVKVGIVINCGYTWPSDANIPDDVMAAYRSMQFYCGWYTHPIFSKEGGYPQIMIDVIGNNSVAEGRAWSRLPVMSLELKEYVRGTADFFGLNYYTSNFGYMRNPCGSTSFWNDQCIGTYQDQNWPVSASDWLRSVPEGLRAVLNWVKDECDNPEIIITENGWSDHGELEDNGRIQYLQGHFNAILDAIEDGVNVKGHTTWSILDNFEWRRGYSERFGITKVDFDSPNRTRTPKASVRFLKIVSETKVIPN